MKKLMKLLLVLALVFAMFPMNLKAVEDKTTLEYYLVLSEYVNTSAMDRIEQTLFNNTVNNAKTVYDDEEATSSEISEITTSLTRLITAATANVDDVKKSLFDALYAAAKFDKTQLPSANQTSFDDALIAATVVFNNARATSEQISSSATDLMEAMKIPTEEVDKTTLEYYLVLSEYVNTSAMDRSEQTLFNNTVNIAQTVYDDEEATSSGISGITTALTRLITEATANVDDVKKSLFDALYAAAKFDKKQLPSADQTSFNNALIAAIGVFNNRRATSEQISSSAADLMEAMKIPTEEVEKGELHYYLVLANYIDLEDKSNQDYAFITHQIGAATNVYEAEDATQTNVDQAIQILEALLNQFVRNADTDKDGLESALYEASKLSAEVIARNQKIIDAAITVYNNVDATEMEIIQVTNALNKVILTAQVNKEQLAQAIDEAKAIKQQDYTEDTYQKVQSALASAQAVYNDITAVQKEVDKATTDLMNALLALVQKPVMDFEDVQNKAAWFYGVVEKAFQKGLMGATGKKDPNKPNAIFFEPDANITRGMVATVLYRMAGKPSVEFSAAFNDVASGLWYTSAIEWAANEKVVSGYKDGRFGPDDNITRQDLAIMLRNYAKATGLDTNATVDFSSFKDGNKVVSYAQSALAFCIEKGLISGSTKADGKYLNPTSNATRAECAKMFSLLDDAIKAQK